MNKQKISHIIVPAVIAVALIVYAAVLLVGIYPDVLITAQDRNIFAGDSMYFGQSIARPFGLFQYVGGYLTQFFYHPALGAGMLIAIWAASAFAGIKAFRLKGMWKSLMIVPVMCLLASEIDLGYWVYCLPIPGYWFSQSVGFLCLMLFLWAARVTPRKFRIIWYVLVGFVLFPAFGWFSYLFTACLALSQFTNDGEKKTIPTWVDGIGIVVAVAAPLVSNALLYDGILDSTVYTAGFPFFRNSTDESTRPVIPFYILTAATLLLPLFGLLKAKESTNKFSVILTCAVPAVVAVASAYYVWSAAFKNDNYFYEIQMTQATMNDDWKGVISVSEKTKHPSRTMVVLKNIALMNTGELAQRSFELGNSGAEIYNPDSLNLSAMHIASAVMYYNYGKMNYSMRWAMEFAVPYGFSPYHLKNLARCADLTGEKQLVKRYAGRLHQLTFYKDWQPAPASKIVKELYAGFPDALDSDDNNVERYLIHNLAKGFKPGSLLISEQALFYSMIMRDASLFCPNFYNFAKEYKKEDLPTNYEEAYCLFVQQYPERFPYRVKVAPSTEANYKQFMSDGNTFSQYATSEKALGEQMFESWSGTYWWFNAFGRDRY